MRVALVHDYLTQFGGAERVLGALMELYPHAPVFTLMTSDRLKFDERRIRTSFLQHLPGARRHHRYFPLLMPLAAEQFDLSPFDVVISASHSFGKGVITSPSTLHLSYCFTPIRYVWDDSHRYVREFSASRFFQKLAPIALSYIRLWDYYAAQRVDEYATLSHYVARRIAKYYRRPATVIAPPVDVDRFAAAAGSGDYYVIVARLVPYKRIEIAIAACEQLGRRLLIAGTGPEEAELKSQAGPMTEFLGFVPDEQLSALYAGARALLFPQEEDFGITPLEAAAAGKPTVAFNAGGARETIQPDVTGLFFDRQTAVSLGQAILRFEQRPWSVEAIRNHAQTYRREVFLRKMKELVEDKWKAFQENQTL